MKSVFVLLFLSTFSNVAISAIDFPDAVSPELAPSARALAMGDAFIGKVDDSMSVFYNPAGLGSVRNAHFHLANLYFEFNRGWTKPSFGGRLTDVASSVAKAFSLDGIRELMVENKGNFSHQRFSLAPNLSMRFFSLGYFYTKQQRAYLGTGAGDQFEFADRTDQGPYIAFNYSLFGGVVKIGFTGMYLMRSELVDQVDPATTIDLESDDYNSGWLNYTIAGIKLTLPIVGLPTFAVTAHNALDEEFRGVKTGKTLSPIKKNIVAGFSISPKLGRALVMHLEANYKDASNEFPDIESSRKVAFGIEFEWRRLMYWRVGYGDGFGSGGIGLRTKRFEFDLTSYAYDRSASGFRGEEDRRFAVSVSSGL